MFKIMVWKDEWQTPYVSQHASEGLREFTPRSAASLGRDGGFIVERLSYQRIQAENGPFVMLLITEDSASMFAARAALTERRQDLQKATAATNVDDWVDPWLAVEGVCRIIDRIGPVSGRTGVPATGTARAALTLATVSLLLMTFTLIDPALFGRFFPRTAPAAPAPAANEAAKATEKAADALAAVARIEKKIESASAAMLVAVKSNAKPVGETVANAVDQKDGPVRDGADRERPAGINDAFRSLKEIAANPASMKFPVDLNYVPTFHEDLKFNVPAAAKSLAVHLTSPMIDLAVFQPRPIEIDVHLATLGGKSIWSGKAALRVETIDAAQKTGRVTATITNITAPDDLMDRTCVLTLDHAKINRSGYRSLASTLFVDVAAED